MPNSLVQFRIDNGQRAQAQSLLEEIGLDIPTYLRMCLARLIREKGIPFSVSAAPKEENLGILALQLASEISQRNGNSQLSLEEINEEIAKARK